MHAVGMYDKNVFNYNRHFFVNHICYICMCVCGLSVHVEINLMYNICFFTWNTLYLTWNMGFVCLDILYCI